MCVTYATRRHAVWHSSSPLWRRCASLGISWHHHLPGLVSICAGATRCLHATGSPKQNLLSDMHCTDSVCGMSQPPRSPWLHLHIEASVVPRTLVEFPKPEPHRNSERTREHSRREYSRGKHSRACCLLQHVPLCHTSLHGLCQTLLFSSDMGNSYGGCIGQPWFDCEH